MSVVGARCQQCEGDGRELKGPCTEIVAGQSVPAEVRSSVSLQRRMAAAAMVAVKHAKTKSLDKVPSALVPNVDILKHGRLGRQTIAPTGECCERAAVDDRCRCAGVLVQFY